MTTALYPKQNPWELEPYYCRHVSAMTTEGLHSKADIAEQLAWRDKRIAELEAELAKRPSWCTTCSGDGYTKSHEGALTHTCRTCHGSGTLRPVTR